MKQKKVIFPKFNNLNELKTFIASNFVNPDSVNCWRGIFYKKYKGLCIYMNLKYSTNKHDPYFGDKWIWISLNKKNKEPKWYDKVRGYWDGFDTDIVIDYDSLSALHKKNIPDTFFGKCMPHESGSESAIMNTFASIMEEFSKDGGAEWTLVKQYITKK